MACLTGRADCINSPYPPYKLRTVYIYMYGVSHREGVRGVQCGAHSLGADDQLGMLQPGCVRSAWFGAGHLDAADLRAGNE